MMIKLANASTGNTTEERQVRICDMYNDNSWEWIIRPPKELANGLSFFAEKLCENDNVLYSQSKRLSLNNLLKKNNYNLACINEKVYCDCSSFVGACVNGVGVLVAVEYLTTSTMRLSLQYKGFQALKYYKERIQKGDILLREGVHCVIVISANDNESDKVIESNNVIGRVEINDINSYLNVRKEPNTNSKVITTLNLNDEVKIIGEVDNWYKVVVNSQQGYCSKQYIKV